MKKSPLMIAAAAALLSGAAVANTSTDSEFRGYQACLEANDSEFSGLVPEREYLISNSEDTRSYYINATAWENGKRVDVAFSCVTAKNGKLLESQVALGTRYAAASDAIQVAGK